MALIQIQKKGEFCNAVATLPPSFSIGILFAGDRLSCVDWGVVAYDSGEVVGLASVSEQGETRSGEPTLIGLWVAPQHRRKGIGRAMLKEIVRAAGKLGLLPLRVDALTPSALAVVKASGFGADALRVYEIGFGIEFPDVVGGGEAK